MVNFVNYKDIDYSKIKDIFSHAKFTAKNKKVGYFEIASGFDTETTSTYHDVNGVKEKLAFTYLWQLGIGYDDNHVYYCYGRTWKTFVKFCKKLQQIGNLSKKRRLIIYIHNMSFEFQFMRTYFNWIDFFATKDRNPIKMLCEYGIEFRDSLILSGYKLSKLADNLTSHKIPKLVGDLNYSLVRTGVTKLSKKELAYSLNDVRILVAYLLEQMNMYKTITKVPLTNTGRVRDYVRKKCFKDKKYHKLMRSLTIDSPKEYQLYKEAFAGGFTHANPHYTGKKLKNISSIDFTSSYPTVLISEKYPSSKAIPQKWCNWFRFNEINEKALQIFTVELWNLKATFLDDNYISLSKCIDFKNQVENNGRVFSADYLKITITSIDWSIIKKTYTADRVRITNQLAFYKDYLPKPIIESILDFYEQKTKLKGIDDKKAEYLHAKGMLNSIYGMSVTSIIHKKYCYDSNTNEWNTKQADISKQLEKYNKNYNRFLFYPYGIFCTSYARANLWNGILNISNIVNPVTKHKAHDFVYSDTDSIKFRNLKLHLPYIDNYNKTIVNKLETTLKHYNIPVERIRPKDVKGQEHTLGVWDIETGRHKEKIYKYFKTLGAKRYIVYQKTKNGYSLEITIAGLPKDTGKKYLLEISDNDINKVFENFNNRLTVPPDKSGKMVSFYDDNPHKEIVTDYQNNQALIESPSSIHLEPTGFTLSMSKQYLDFLEDLAKGEITYDLYPIVARS